MGGRGGSAFRDVAYEGQASWGKWPLRAGLLFLLFAALLVGPWAQFAPESFWEGFPAFGRGWVSTDGPYNEHLIRDVGGLQLGMAVVLLAALLQPTRPLVLVAALASVTWQVPHVFYHLVHVDDLPTFADRVAQSVGLIAGLVVAAALLVVALWWGGTDNS
jgi:hypothetical protein